MLPVPGAGLAGGTARPRVPTHRSRRRPRPSTAGRWVACAAGGTGHRRNPLRTVPFRSGRPRRGPENRAAPGAARPNRVRRRSRPPHAAAPGSATRQRWKCSRTPAGRRVPGRWARHQAPAHWARHQAPGRWARHRVPGRWTGHPVAGRWAASVHISPAPDRRSRWTIRPVTGRAAGRSRPWILTRAWPPPTGALPAGLARTGPPRTGRPRRRIRTGGAGSGVRPARARLIRRLTGTPTRRAPTWVSRPSGRPGQPGPAGLAVGPGELAVGPGSAAPAG